MVKPVAATVRSVLKHLFGFLGKETRERVAKQISDGNVTDEECRRFFVRELNNIRGNFDGIGRKDLLSSVCFLQDGVNDLYWSASHSDSNDIGTREEAESSSDTGPHSPADDAIALVNAIQPLRSSEYFESATRGFMLARERATKAFRNEALSIADRIQASRIRIIARILENLEHPNAGVGNCLRYLKELHEYVDIRDVPFLSLHERLRSCFFCTKQPNVVSAVHTANEILFHFARKFTKSPPNIYDRISISHYDRNYHPMLGNDLQNVTFDEQVDLGNAVKNSKEEIVASIWERGTLKIFKRSGKGRELCDVPKNREAREWKVCAMDVDREDNIYVITSSKELEYESLKFHLFIFDSNGNKKLECTLPFVQNHFVSAVSIAINLPGRLAIVDRVNKVMYIGNACVNSNAYNVEKTFNVKEVPLSIHFSSRNARVLNLNKRKIIVLAWHSVYVYTENGKLEKEIKIPHKYGAGKSLEVDHATKHIRIETWNPVMTDNNDDVIQFSESEKLLDTFSVALKGQLFKADLAHGLGLNSNPSY